MYDYIFLNLYNLEAIRKLKTKSDEKEDETGRTMGYPDRPEEPDCIYYLRTGICGYGDDCKFNHPTYIEQVTQQKKLSNWLFFICFSILICLTIHRLINMTITSQRESESQIVL